MKKYPTLYAKSNTGKVLEWFVEQENEKFRVCSGQKTGKKVYSEFTTCEGKNIGKANETLPKDQCEKEIAAIYKKQKEQKNYWESEKDIDKTNYFEVQLAHKWEQYGCDADWSSGIYVSPKLDGLRVVLTKDGAFSRNGKKFISFPHIFNKLKPFFDKNPDLVFDGECYTNRLSNDFNKIISLAKQQKPTAEDLKESEKYLQYWIFDFPSCPGGYHERYTELKGFINKNFKKDDHIILVEHELIFSEEELKQKFGEYIEAGYEGIMVNSYSGKYEQKRSKNILKYKEFIDEEFEILNITEGTGNRAGMFGRATLKMKDGKTFDSNARGNQEFYIDLLKNKKNYIGQMATVRYQNLTPDGIPRFPVLVCLRPDGD